ncbi:hypothetical protein GC167_00875 [bacterium]|nr:hypothetical protein [bacterium]
MPVESRSILVLRLIRYGEQSGVVHALEPELGRLAVYVPGMGGGRRRLSPGLFMPLRMLRVSLFRRGSDVKGHLPTVREAEAEYRYERLYDDPYRSGVALFLAEWLDKAIAEQGSIELLWNFLNAALRAYDQSENIVLFPHWILAKTASFLGYAIQSAPGSDWSFDVERGDWVRFNGVDSPKGVDGLLSALVSSDFDQMQALVSSPAQRARLIELLLDFHQRHLPGMGVVKSLEVLRALWG